MPFNLTGTGAGYNATGKFGASLNAGRGVTSVPVLTSGVTAFTASCWLKGGAAGGIKVALGQAGLFWIGHDASGNATARYGGGAEASLGSTVSVVDGAWHFIEINAGPAGGKLFVDGVLVNAQPGTLASTSPTYSANLYVRDLNGSFTYDGEVDDCAIYNAVLHTATFTSPTTATSPSAANLVALWNLDNNLNDSAGAASAPTINTQPSSQSVVAPGTVTFTVVATASSGSLTYQWQVSINSGTSWANVSTGTGGTTASYTTPATAVTGGSANNGDQYRCVVTDTNGSTTSNAATLTVTSGVVAVTFTGTVPTQSLSVGTPATISLASYFSGTQTPFAYSVFSGTLPAGLTLNTSTGQITGTPSTAGSAGIVVRATDTSSNTANTNSFTVSVTASATKAPNDPGIVYSPYNWLVTGSAAKSINPGAYFRTLFTGSSCTLNFDMGGASMPYSRLLIRVDGRTLQSASIAATVTVTLPSGQDNTKHLLEVIFDASSETLNRWNAPQNVAVVLTGITLANTSDTLSAPDSRPRKLLVYGDSITEGVRTLALNGSADVDRNSAAVSWPLELGRLMNAEVGAVGFGSQGIIDTANGNVPAMVDSWNLLWSGQARSFAVAPDYCIWLQGHNDGAANTVTAGTTMLNAMLAAMPGTQFVLFKPFSGNQAANLQSIRSGCNEPGRARYIDTAGYFNTADSSDALHPYGYTCLASIAPKMAVAISTAAATTTRSLSLTLTTDGTTPATSLSGLKWVFRDSFTGAIMASGAAGTTNGSGVFSASVNTTLASGAVGWLEVNNSDGTLTQNPMKGYSGPVTVI